MSQLDSTIGSRKGKHLISDEMKQIKAFKKLDHSNCKIADQLEGSS